MVIIYPFFEGNANSELITILEQQKQFFEPNSCNSQNCYERNHFIKILNVFGLFHETLVGEIIACLINSEK